MTSGPKKKISKSPAPQRNHKSPSTTYSTEPTITGRATVTPRGKEHTEQSRAGAAGKRTTAVQRSLLICSSTENHRDTLAVIGANDLTLPSSYHKKTVNKRTLKYKNIYIYMNSLHG
jgi:hypothetical protein